MRIGIATFGDSSNNYGQLLQCWALQEYLRLGEHDPYLIRMTAANDIQLWKRIARNLTPSKITYWLSGQRKKDAAQRAKNTQDDAARDFWGFAQSEISISDGHYSCHEELVANPPEADAYICGSDQVWGLPLNTPDAQSWYLDFGDPNVRRIAYAASAGRDLSERELPRFAELVGKLDAVSVRERTLADTCKQLGIEAEVTLDPTLLLEASEYRKLADHVEESIRPSVPYLFAYVLNVETADDIHWKNVSAFVRERCLDVVPVYSSGYIAAHNVISGYERYLPTIYQWLRLVDGANCVLTTSFHGTVFSILFEKPFIVTPLAGRAASNDRLVSLLEPLGLSARMYTEGVSFEEQMDAPIDWDFVRSALSDMRKRSRDFLDRALVLNGTEE